MCNEPETYVIRSLCYRSLCDLDSAKRLEEEARDVLKCRDHRAIMASLEQRSAGPHLSIELDVFNDNGHAEPRAELLRLQSDE